MPRYPRDLLKGYPHHIVQRGHNRQPVFAEDRDFRIYLANFAERSEILDISVLSYCLMTNHVHLLVRPERDGSDISSMMRVLAARQTRHVNRVKGRSGTLWGGRFHHSIVDSDEYLLACCRYIELNPVHAGMVSGPEKYPWSSYLQRIGCLQGAALVPLSALDGFPSTAPDAFERDYASFVAAGSTELEHETISKAVRRNQLTGGQRFREEIERKLGRRVSTKAPGRPANSRK